jgi:Tol biopolymer transport system component
MNQEDKMKNRLIHLVLVFTIIASLAACAAPPTLTVAPMVPIIQPPAPPTQSHTEIAPTSNQIPPRILAISRGDQPAGFAVTLDNLILIKTDGTIIKEITDETRSTYDEHPSWSPDGTRIAYHSGHGLFPGYAIWVINTDGTNKKKITEDPICALVPAWSPDSTKIAFTNYDNGKCQIYFVNPDGTELTKVTKGPNDLYPQWMPDGTLLFVRKVGVCDDLTGDIFSINSDGSNLQQLTKLGHVGAFGISPDGKMIAYQDTKKNQIMVIPLDGSQPSKPIFNVKFSTFAVQPSWSNDGKIIAIAANSWGTMFGSDLFLVNADGSGFTEVPTDRGVFDPVWKPE